MAGTTSTRQDDETLLEAIALRCDGVSSAVAGKALGMTRERLRTATNRVKDADAQCGECIEGAYW